MPHQSIRSHAKSRAGCLACKLRRIKCNEAKPICQGCYRRGDECVYVPTPKRRSRARPAASARAATRAAPNAPSDDTPAEGYSSRHLLDLRLMHHYGDAAVESLMAAADWPRAVADVMRHDVPDLAQKNPFLMDVLLSVSMLHMVAVQPELGTTLPLQAYRDKAVTSLHQNLISRTVEKTRRPVAIASILMRLTSFAADRLLDRPGLWLTNAIAMPMAPSLSLDLVDAPTAALGPTGSPPDSSLDTSQPYVINPLGLAELGPPSPCWFPPSLGYAVQIRETDTDWHYRDDFKRAAEGLGFLFGSLAYPDHECWVPFKTRLWPFQFVTPRFSLLAQRENHRALAILAHYLPFFKFLPAGWVFEGVATGDMNKIHALISPSWKPYLAMPRQAVLIEDPAEAKIFLLAQLCPADDAGLESTLLSASATADYVDTAV